MAVQHHAPPSPLPPSSHDPRLNGGHANQLPRALEGGLRGPPPPPPATLPPPPPPFSPSFPSLHHSDMQHYAASAAGGSIPTANPPLSSLSSVVERLKEWTEKNGWFELKQRLFDSGRTDYLGYSRIEPLLLEIPGKEGHFLLRDREVQLVGHRLDPIVLLDCESREVMWDAESNTRYNFPWAKERLRIKKLPPPSSSFQVLDKLTGDVVVEVGGGATRGNADPLVLQAVLMEAIPFLQRPGVEEMTSMAGRLGLELVIAVREFSSSETSHSNAQLDIK
eukprot:765210-Hanusia_phi.AAC.2